MALNPAHGQVGRSRGQSVVQCVGGSFGRSVCPFIRPSVHPPVAPSARWSVDHCVGRPVGSVRRLGRPVGRSIAWYRLVLQSLQQRQGRGRGLEREGAGDCGSGLELPRHVRHAVDGRVAVRGEAQPRPRVVRRIRHEVPEPIQHVSNTTARRSLGWGGRTELPCRRRTGSTASPRVRRRGLISLR